MCDSVLNESALLKPLKQHLGFSQPSFRPCLLRLFSLQHSYCLCFLGIVMARCPVWSLFEWSWKVRVYIREEVHWKTFRVANLQPACGGAGERAMSCDTITLWWTCSCWDTIKWTHARAARGPDLGSRGQSVGAIWDWVNWRIWMWPSYSIAQWNAEQDLQKRRNVRVPLSQHIKSHSLILVQ